MKLRRRKDGIDMKVYKNVVHVVFDHRSNVDSKFRISIAEAIKENLEDGYQSEVQYSTCADSGTVIYSALILGYTEE